MPGTASPACREPELGGLAQPLWHGAGGDVPRVWHSTASQQGQGQWHAPQGWHMSVVLGNCSSSSPGALALWAEPPRGAQASLFTLASPLEPGVCKGSSYQAGVAQRPVVLAGSSERAGGGFSSRAVAKAYPESGKWVWISPCQARPGQRFWNWLVS